MFAEKLMELECHYTLYLCTHYTLYICTHFTKLPEHACACPTIRWAQENLGAITDQRSRRANPVFRLAGLVANNGEEPYMTQGTISKLSTMKALVM